MDETRRQLARRMLKLRGEIGEFIEASSVVYEPDAMDVRPHQTEHLLYHGNRLVGRFQSPHTADFVRRAPRWLRQLLDYIGQLEAEAYSTRAQRRRMVGIESRLARLRELDPCSPAGLRALQDLYVEVDRRADAEVEREFY